MSTVQKRIDAFAKRDDDGAFSEIRRADVARGLRERVAKPETVDQGEGSLCGPAALMFAVLRKDPLLYVDYVISLYDNGHGVLGNSPGLWVNPSGACKAFDPKGKIPPVDWIALAGLRDSANDFLDYADTDDKVAGITSPSLLSVWLDKCGFKDRQNVTNVYFTKDKDNLQDASDFHNDGHTVFLFCKGDTMKGIKGGLTAAASHWVVMTRPARFSGGSVALEVFTWGQLRKLNVLRDVFLSTYFGFVCGKP